ncbi:MAG TPA: hypothetical protein PKA06_02500 [Gemmatales bacterium]|nr:hypothetical protein [Gemmatales bacterium]HMP16411.1 hypothetical protein [Gemmatales bacterium]
MTATLTVRKPRLEHSATGSCLSVQLDGPDFSQQVYYRVNRKELALDSTPFLAAALPLAMAKGWNLALETAVSPRLVATLPELQAIYCNWIPGFQRVHCEISLQKAEKRSPRIGTFFSGGVDSYYTFLKHQPEINSLIFITGFDIPLHKRELARRIADNMRSTAAAFGLPLVEVETNLREFCDRFISWRMYHGAALASVAHVLSPELGTVYLAATHTYADLFPCGSHPLLDPLWSSEAVEICHDGCEATRFQKVAKLADNDIALRNLRVCYRNKHTELNCGQCEKCLRTMISLYSLNKLQHCTTFHTPLNLSKVASLRLGDNPRILMYVEENLSALRERKDSSHVIDAVRRSMRRPSLLHHLNRQAKPLFRRSTYLRWLGQSSSKQS